MPKKRKRKGSGPKARRPNNPRDEHRGAPALGLTKAVGRSLGRQWVSGLGVAAVVAIVWAAIAVATGTQIKVSTYGAAALISIFAFALAVGVNQHWKPGPAPFSFNVVVCFFDGAGEPTQGAFWVRYGSSYGDTVTPSPRCRWRCTCRSGIMVRPMPW